MNYPNGIKKQNNSNHNESYNSKLSHKNRGMTLENDINLSNEYYCEIDKAYIYKKPTPIKIVNVDYPSRDKAVIKEAYFTIPSTTDYNGIYKGKYIDFESKETKSKTSFSLSNIHSHQIKHLKNIYKHNGIAFLIVRFTTLDETFLLEAEKLSNYIEDSSKKSISIEFFRKNAYILKNGYTPRIDYLTVVDKLIGGKEYEKKGN